MRLRLSPVERGILAAAKHRANEPIRHIGRLTGYRDHTVRYHLANLVEKGIVYGRVPFINVYPLGYYYITLTFSFRTESEKDKRKILDALIASEQVSFLGAVGGDFQYIVAVCVRSNSEFASFLESLTTVHGNFFHEKSLSTHLRFDAFSSKHLDTEIAAPPVLSYGDVGSKVNIDEVDHKLLSLLSTGSYRSQRDLARATGIAMPTVNRRIKRLEEAGVIAGYIYRTDLTTIGIQEFVLLVHARGVNPDFKNELSLYASQHPNMVRMIQCLGTWDYEIGIEIPEARKLCEIIDGLYERFALEINKVKILQLFEHLKFSAYPFISLGQ